MEDEDENGGLFNIEVSSDDSVEETEKIPRDFQSEEDFQRVRRDWKVKVEKGKIWKTLKLPIDNPTKPESQTILHAIEELYFARKYKEALKIVSDVSKGSLNGEFSDLVESYRRRCEARVKMSGT